MAGGFVKPQVKTTSRGLVVLLVVKARRRVPSSQLRLVMGDDFFREAVHPGAVGRAY
jgi:hypothetical protein